MGHTQQGELKKSLGKWDLLALGFGAIIGWGWLSMGGYWISSAGPLGACLAFIIMGFMMCLVGLTYCELTSMMPKAGGVINFTWRAMGSKVAFVAGWMMTLGYVAMTAWEGLATVAAVDFLFPVDDSKVLYSIAGCNVSALSLVVAIGTAILMFVLTIRGMDALSKFTNISVIIMVIIVVIFAVAAVVKGDISNLEPGMPNGMAGVLSICLMCALFLGGFDTVAQASEESSVSPKSIGKVLIGCLVLSILWYLVTLIATALSLNANEVKGSVLAAGTAINKVFGSPVAGVALIVAGIFGILTSWVALYIGSTRLIFGMARVGMLPKAFAKVHPKYGTPYLAIYFVGIITVLAPFLGRTALQWLSNAGGFGINFGYGAAALAFLVLRFKEPKAERPYKVACGKLVGLLAVGMSFTLIIISFPGVSMFSLIWPQEALIVLAWIGIGAVFFVRNMIGDKNKNVDEQLRHIVYDRNNAES